MFAEVFKRGAGQINGRSGAGWVSIRKSSSGRGLGASVSLKIGGLEAGSAFEACQLYFLRDRTLNRELVIHVAGN